MRDNPAQPDSPEQAAAEDQGKAEARAAESAAIRRRWLTLGEILAVIAVVISGLTLWNNWSERSEAKAEQSADARRASTRAATLTLVAADSGKRTLALKAASPEQSVQSQTLLFPAALGTAPVRTTGEPRIETEWFEHALEKARESAKLPDDSRGDERLPVAIVTRFLVDGAPHEDVALYDVGYTVSGKFLGGHSVSLRGLSFVMRVDTAAAQARVDARWKAQLQAK